MNCHRCGAKLKENAKFCSNCGIPIDDHQNQYDYSYQYSIPDEEEYLKAFVGKNYDKIKQKRFSLPTFFFGIYYFLYRKVWLYAILWTALNVISIIWIDNDIALPLISIINITLSIKFNSIYLNYAQKKVDKIKQKNPDKSSKEILEIIKRKGNTSIAAPIIAGIGIIVVFFASAFTYGVIIGIQEATKEDNTQIIENTNVNELFYIIPEGFKKNKFNSESYKNYTYTKNYDYCYINIEKNNSILYNTAEELLKAKVYTNQSDNVSNIETITINNINWERIQVESIYGKKSFYYATQYNNQLYYIEYSIGNNSSDVCLQMHDEFINSLTFSNPGTNSV